MKSLYISLLIALLGAATSARGDVTTLQCGPIKEADTLGPICQGSCVSAWTIPLESVWARDVKGMRSDFVNIYVHGSLEKLNAAFVASGWQKSLENNKQDNSLYIHSVLSYEDAKAALDKAKKDPKIDRTPSLQKYLQKFQQQLQSTMQIIASMPVSNEYVQGVLETAAFEKDNHPFGGRHHLRVWETHQNDEVGNPVLAVAGNHDIGIIFDAKRPNQLFLNHRVEPNADLERDFIVTDLKNSGFVQSEGDATVTFSCPPPRDHIYSADQKVKILYLK